MPPKIGASFTQYCYARDARRAGTEPLLLRCLTAWLVASEVAGILLSLPAC